MNRLPDITVPFEPEEEVPSEPETVEETPDPEPQDIFVRNPQNAAIPPTPVPSENEEPEGEISDPESEPELPKFIKPIDIGGISPENPHWTCACGATLKMPTKYRMTKHLNSKGHKFKMMTDRTPDEQSKLDKQREKALKEEEKKLKTREKEREERYFKKFKKLQEEEKKVKEELRLKIMNDEIKKKVEEEELEKERQKKYFEMFEKQEKEKKAQLALQQKKEETGYGIYSNYF